jgi:hypothetical protein
LAALLNEDHPAAQKLDAPAGVFLKILSAQMVGQEYAKAFHNDIAVVTGEYTTWGWEGRRERIGSALSSRLHQRGADKQAQNLASPAPR